MRLIPHHKYFVAGLVPLICLVLVQIPSVYADDDYDGNYIPCATYNAYTGQWVPFPTIPCTPNDDTADSTPDITGHIDDIVLYNVPIHGLFGNIIGYEDWKGVYDVDTLARTAYRLGPLGREESGCGEAFSVTKNGSTYSIGVAVSFTLGGIVSIGPSFSYGGGSTSYQIFNSPEVECLKYYGKYWKHYKKHTCSMTGEINKYKKDQFDQWILQGVCDVTETDSCGWKMIGYKTSKCDTPCS
jgi:hypothetical protein